MIGSEKSYSLNLPGWAIAKYLVYSGSSAGQDGIVERRQRASKIFRDDLDAIQAHFLVQADQHKLWPELAVLDDIRAGEILEVETCLDDHSLMLRIPLAVL